MGSGRKFGYSSENLGMMPRRVDYVSYHRDVVKCYYDTTTTDLMRRMKKESKKIRLNYQRD